MWVSCLLKNITKKVCGKHWHRPKISWQNLLGCTASMLVKYLGHIFFLYGNGSFIVTEYILFIYSHLQTTLPDNKKLLLGFKFICELKTSKPYILKYYSLLRNTNILSEHTIKLIMILWIDGWIACADLRHTSKIL